MKNWMILGMALVLLTFGCVSSQTPSNDADAMMKKGDESMVKGDTAMGKTDDATMEKEDPVMEDKGDSMMTKGIEYLPFTKSAYNQAKADGKTIFLEFYANWCPTCKAQHPALVEGLSKISSDGLAAFQVNYKDSETDADEQALAQQFNITYQHTHVVTNASGETLLKSQEQWSAADVMEKIGSFG
jgi:thiol:disulfide interchange protein